RDLSLSLAAGERVALVGPSGSGKSSLIAVAAGLERPSAGRVVLFGQEIARRPNAMAEARAWLDRVGLSQRLRHYPHQLSGGEQQRVALARALAPRPALLFADEPTGNLDAANAHKVADMMFELVAETGAALVMVTHDEALAQRADRIVRLRDGRVAAPEAAAAAVKTPA